MTRRSFVAAVGVTTVAVATLPPAGICARGRPADPRRYRFFDADEAQFIEAACERLIPADHSGPGATDADVPGYLDRQLAGPWGAGEQLYRAGSWQPGSPIPAGHRAQTPAALFRSTLRAINYRLEDRGIPFGRLPGPAQDALLTALQGGYADLPGVPAAEFFALLLAMTVEGFFGNAPKQSRRDRIAWRLSAFPGAHAATV